MSEFLRGTRGHVYEQRIGDKWLKALRLPGKRRGAGAGKGGTYTGVGARGDGCNGP